MLSEESSTSIVVTSNPTKETYSKSNLNSNANSSSTSTLGINKVNNVPSKNSISMITSHPSETNNFNGYPTTNSLCMYKYMCCYMTMIHKKKNETGLWSILFHTTLTIISKYTF